MQLKSLFDNFKWGLNLNITIIDLFQVVILTGIIFYLCKTFYRTRAWILIKGLLAIGGAYLLVCVTRMTVIQSIMEGLFSILMVSIVIMFQPDLQKLVENVGKRSVTSTINSIIKKPQVIEDKWASDRTIYKIVSACQDMSEAKTGALIVLERGIPLKEYIDLGISLKADMSSQLLLNIFEKNTPLHDGAVIISGDKIEAATCYLPLTLNENISKNLGTRHRAAIGISEVTDSVSVVVSEETGAMSICVNGKIQHNIDRSKLSNELHKFCKKHDEKLIKTNTHSTPKFLKIISPILAILTCLFILNVNDPIVTKRFNNIPVTIQNESILLSKNQSYTIESGDEVSVVLKGHRSVIDSMETIDILATADIEEMSIVNAVPINIAITEEFEGEVAITSNQNVLKLALENLTKVEIPIEVATEGVSTDKLFKVESDGINTLTVMSTESIAKTLSKAVVVVDITGKNSDFTTTKEAVVYDKNGNVVSSTKLSLNSQVPVKGTAYPTKAVPLNIKLGEVEADKNYYYELNSVETEAETIQIAAEQSVLDTIEAFDVTILPEEGLETVTTMEFKLENYLTENTYLGPTQSKEVSASVSITKYQKVKVSVDTSLITLKGKNEEIETLIITAPIEIEVVVDVSKISADAISFTMLNPSIEISSDLGEHTAKLMIAEIEGVSLSSEVTISYSNTEKEVA